MKATSSRRQSIMAALLLLALLGAALRYWAPNPSVTRDIGTLLLVLWLPAVGNLIAFLVRQAAMRRQRAKSFDAAGEFAPQLTVRLVPLPEHATIIEGLAPDATRCTVVLGTEGFSARTSVPLARVLGDAGADSDVPLQFLRPGLALARLAPGTSFHLVLGDIAVAQGTVAQVVSPASLVSSAAG
jgi:hypothetical protein